MIDIKTYILLDFNPELKSEAIKKEIKSIKNGESIKGIIEFGDDHKNYRLYNSTLAYILIFNPSLRVREKDIKGEKRIEPKPYWNLFKQHYNKGVDQFNEDYSFKIKSYHEDDLKQFKTNLRKTYGPQIERLKDQYILSLSFNTVSEIAYQTGYLSQMDEFLYQPFKDILLRRYPLRSIGFDPRRHVRINGEFIPTPYKNSFSISDIICRKYEPQNIDDFKSCLFVNDNHKIADFLDQFANIFNQNTIIQCLCKFERLKFDLEDLIEILKIIDHPNYPKNILTAIKLMQENGGTVKFKDGEIIQDYLSPQSKKPKPELPKTFDELFYNKKLVQPSIDILKEIEPPLIDSDYNYIGKLKGIICVWIDELQRQGIVKSNYLEERKLLASLIPQKIMRFSIDESMFGKFQKKAEENYRTDIKTKISQIKLSQNSQ